MPALSVYDWREPDLSFIDSDVIAGLKMLADRQQQQASTSQRLSEMTAQQNAQQLENQRLNRAQDITQQHNAAQEDIERQKVAAEKAHWDAYAAYQGRRSPGGRAIPPDVQLPGDGTDDGSGDGTPAPGGGFTLSDTPTPDDSASGAPSVSTMLNGLTGSIYGGAGLTAPDPGTDDSSVDPGTAINGAGAAGAATGAVASAASPDANGQPQVTVDGSSPSGRLANLNAAAPVPTVPTIPGLPGDVASPRASSNLPTDPTFSPPVPTPMAAPKASPGASLAAATAPAPQSPGAGLSEIARQIGPDAVARVNAKFAGVQSGQFLPGASAVQLDRELRLAQNNQARAARTPPVLAPAEIMRRAQSNGLQIAPDGSGAFVNDSGGRFKYNPKSNAFDPTTVRPAPPARGPQIKADFQGSDGKLYTQMSDNTWAGSQPPDGVALTHVASAPRPLAGPKPPTDSARQQYLQAQQDVSTYQSAVNTSVPGDLKLPAKQAALQHARDSVAQWEKWFPTLKQGSDTPAASAGIPGLPQSAPAPLIPGLPQSAPGAASIPSPQTKTDFDQLPSGTVYLGKDGKKYRKP